MVYIRFVVYHLLASVIMNDSFVVHSFIGVHQVETIGDAYMAVAGCPNAEDPAVAALRMAGFARAVVSGVSKYHPQCLGSRTLQIRVGLHSGPVVAGVVGTKMPRCACVYYAITAL